MKSHQIIAYIENDGEVSDLRKAKETTSQTLVIPSSISEAEGFFGKESMHWKLYREPGIIVAGISALLLQIAHPAVAEGVKIYSAYQKDFLGRAHRTIVSMTRIWFGSRSEAEQSATRLYHIHGHIKGVYSRTENGRKKAISYCANEASLLSWVLATMTKATIEAYEKVYTVLSDQQKEQFFQETKITAQLMGIPLEVYPENWKAFLIYYEGVISGNTLEVGETAKPIAVDLFKAYFPLSGLMKTMAAGFLPPQLRQAYGLTKRKKRFWLLLAVVHIIMRLTPATLRFAPHYYQAIYRLAKAKQKTPSLLARWHHWVANTIPLPLFSNKLRPHVR